jgi:hypothetical protein
VFFRTNRSFDFFPSDNMPAIDHAWMPRRSSCCLRLWNCTCCPSHPNVSRLPASQHGNARLTSPSFAFPSFLMAPPYLFSAVGVGLMQVPAIIGFILATFLGGYLADTITARVIRKQNGHVAPAQRLVGLLPAFWVSPVGCIITAFACSQKLHWIAIAFGFGMGKNTTQSGNVYQLS